MSEDQDWRTDRDAKRPPSTAERARERMSADYDDDDLPRRRGSPGKLAALLGSDEATRKLLFGAIGVGGVLLVGIGGWSLMGHHTSGIPVLGPPPGPVRDVPVDPGGMQISGSDDAVSDTTGQGEAHLAPAPEQPHPDALARQYGQPATPPETQTKTSSPPSAETSGASKADLGDGDTGDDLAPVGSAPAKPAEKPAAVAPAPKAAPASGAAEKKAAEVPPTPRQPAPAASPVAPPAAPSSTTTGGFAVQLGALDSDAEAQRQWEIVRKQAPDLFADRKPVVERADRGGRTYFRLRVAGFDSAQSAKAFCIKAHARSVACTPARF
ncbi:SPOR domain-containing protein [Brytella acorum]|uniref:SPOR domain-containing protein n=1 Tax=Brytella acorum TaxID=2959299 RepID=A0AA35UVN5_9PROT|nr:SPOR domain-containing protein [Brytella acorum]MDF3625465.1 SPOR domain-containing protein [Brytella acorum]CAI9120316.1 SPOR domain-containing protein [Brytella acorum]